MSLYVKTAGGAENIGQLYIKTPGGAEALSSLYVKTSGGAELVWSGRIAGGAYINVDATPNMRVYSMSTLALIGSYTVNYNNLGRNYSLAAVGQRLYAVNQTVPASQSKADLFEVNPRNMAILNSGTVIAAPTKGTSWIGGNTSVLYGGVLNTTGYSLFKIHLDTLANLGSLSLSGAYGYHNHIPTGGIGTQILVGGASPTGALSSLVEYHATGAVKRVVLDRVKGSALGDTDGEQILAITETNRQVCSKIKYGEFVVMGHITDLPAAATNPAVMK